MKNKIKILLILVSIISCYNAQSQTIANEKMNVVYVGVDNPISISVFDYNCKDIYLIANKGKLTKKACSKYSYIPNEEGEILFTVVHKEDGIEKILVDTIAFRAKNIPNPSTGQKSPPKDFSIVALRNEKELSAEILGYDYSNTFKIIKFDYLFLRDTTIITTGKIWGAKFDTYMMNAIMNLQPGDRIFFDDIAVEDKEGEIRKLNSIILKLNI